MKKLFSIFMLATFILLFSVNLYASNVTNEKIEGTLVKYLIFK